MSKAFVVVLDQKFAPFNFFDIPYFPNPVPHIDEWEGHLPKFKDENDDIL